MTTVRLDARLEATLERLARERGQNRSDVIRDAIEDLARRSRDGAPSALQKLRPFVGVADSGGRELSTRTGEQFREALEAKRRARNPGWHRSAGRAPGPQRQPP